jgi:D-inositol-3-phosphate glycosyltransferase
VQLGERHFRRTVSEFVARCLPPNLAPAPDRLDIIPHGLPALYRTEPPARRTDAGNVLGVGNVVAVKNFTTLVRAYAALPETLRARHPLVIAGDASGPEGERVRATAAAHGVRDRVRLTGYLGPHALQREFEQAEVFVVSSLQESFSFALLEAMASALPCVVTDCGGATEVGGEAIAVIQDARDVRGMRDAMEHLLHDASDRDRLGALARRRALSYSWEKTARRTLEVYERVLARPARERV